jgi:hypothetical protein
MALEKQMISAIPFLSRKLPSQSAETNAELRGVLLGI